MKVDAVGSVAPCDLSSSKPVTPRDPAAAELTPAEYALFASVARVRRMYTGETLFRRGDLGTTMFVISSGAVELDFGEDLIAKRLGPREFFGELGLLIGDHARSADAVATSDGELLELRHEEFQLLVERDSTHVSYFLRRAIMRVVLNEQGLIRRLRRRNQDLESALDSLRATAHQLNQTEVLIRTDELTGLYNRRGLSLHLQERRRSGTLSGLALLLVDCDRFKQVNDEHGHLVGDRVLQGVANILRSVVGPGDLACRLGGDEFCLLVKAGDRDEVMRYADFVVATAHGLLQVPQSPPLICTLSLGACLLAPDADWNDWYARADAALYRAKRLGGSRVEWQDASLAPA
ncbi:GGDEF domain-containing protein [Montanilutibacter psychrotolerans]|uniref:diguanylate cyclase n=1 Tax=Montanilutibacter psychrotolerans TaxID=1327343 RepID=A0A3M8SRB3_9GAMM|nr:GGDEF domain-containing protein [Lysobacter psychrotolerans]RNF83857.1 GGDEF domain-containing protein [Lysobacter psychrotolerans]